MKEKKVKIGTVAKTIALAVVLYLAIVAVIVYLFPLSGTIAKSPIIKKTIKYVPYPATFFAGRPIGVDKLAMELDSVKTFYENQDFSKLGMRIDFDTTDGKKRLQIKEKEILNKLIEDAVIESEANKVNIRLTNEIVDQEVTRKLREYGTGDYLRDNLQKLYGWNIEDFKVNIVKPDMYKEKLAENVAKNEPSRKSAREKINAAENELLKGIDFKEVAKNYSEGKSAKDGGELGWFSFDQMVPEVALKISDKESGYQSEVIESSIGYHIVRVEDKKTENNVPMLKLSQIFVRFKSFPQWLQEVKKNYNIFIPLREFRWNSEAGAVEFLDEGMKNYEKDLLEKPSNDPSVIF